MNSETCPSCKTSWVGEEIPKDIAHLYGGGHWYRCVGIDGGRMGIYDGLVAIACPDCKEEFPRNGSDWAKGLFKKYKETLQNESS